MALFKLEKQDNRQLENTYIYYMIFSSYFHKCVCRTTSMERKLLLYYKEMPVSRQESMEGKAIADADSALGQWKSLLEISDCVSYITRRDKNLIVRFLTGFEEIILEVDPKGKVEAEVRILAS